MLNPEKVYLGSDNAIDLLLKAEGEEVDLVSVTRMTLQIGSHLVDSATDAGVFNWTTRASEGILILTLGQHDLDTGEYGAILTVYDSTNTHGVVWGVIPLVVLDLITTPTAPDAIIPGVVIPPSEEPVTLGELKTHLRVEMEDTEDDDFIEDIGVVAREQVEDFTRRAIMTQTWDMCLDGWPRTNYIEIPKGQLQSVTFIKYYDVDGNATTMVANTDYLVERNGDNKGRIVLPDGVSWPSDSLYPSHPICIRYVCGWSNSGSVPRRIKSGIKRATTLLYEDRGDSLDPKTDRVFQALLFPLRLWI